MLKDSPLLYSQAQSAELLAVKSELENMKKQNAGKHSTLNTVYPDANYSRFQNSVIEEIRATIKSYNVELTPKNEIKTYCAE